jgi:tellurite methyltransferase
VVRLDIERTPKNPLLGKEYGMRADQKRWDKRYRARTFVLGKEANPFLKKHIHLLPKGRALDIAAGEGRNAVFLAQHGFEVDAVDISPIGLAKARRLARQAGVEIHPRLADLDRFLIPEEQYDLIADFYFLSRRLIPRIKKGLRTGGTVIFQTYLIDHRDLSAGGPRDPKYFLKHNELLRLFKGFRILIYREGIFKEHGKRRAIASVIAQKP